MKRMKENYIEKQNKGTGEGRAAVIKGCAQDCAAATTTTTSSVPMMKRIYSTAAIAPSQPCDRLHTPV